MDTVAILTIRKGRKVVAVQRVTEHGLTLVLVDAFPQDAGKVMLMMGDWREGKTVKFKKVKQNAVYNICANKAYRPVASTTA